MSTLTAEAIDRIVSLARTKPMYDLVAIDERTWLMFPEGQQQHDITTALREDADTPRRVAGNVELYDMTSFVEFVRRMADRPRTVLFGDQVKSLVTAIFDHHDPRQEQRLLTESLPPLGDDGTPQPAPARLAEVATANPQPRWGAYRASYAFPQSKPWKTWTERNLKPMSQEELAIFLEENLVDVLPDAGGDETILKAIQQLGLVVADPLRLLDMSRTFRITSTEEGAESTTLASGETELVYKQTQKATDAAGNRTVVPTAFVVALPVFEGGAAYRLLVRLRTRKREQRHSFTFDIYQLARTQQAAFQGECLTLSQAIEVPLFFGAAPGRATA